MLVLLNEPPPSRPTALPEDEPLPEYQGPARVTLLVIDPYLVHAYWEADSAKAERAVLRVYDAANEAANHFDVPVSLPARNWYIHLWTPERSYYAELGAMDESGCFHLLARSNTVETPRAWPVTVPEAGPADSREVEHYDAVPAAAESAAPETQLEPEPEPPQPEPRFEALQTEPRPEAPLPLVAARQTAPPAEAPSEEPMPQAGRPVLHVVKPVDAARVLRERLEEIYASRQWTARPRETTKAHLAEKPAVPSPAARPRKPTDLTDLAEEQFSPGVSSKTSGPPD